MKPKTILLVEDNPDDEALALRAFGRQKIAAEINVVRDGAEALDYLMHRGPYAGSERVPSVVLLDLKLPKIDGLEVLRRIRAHEPTRLLPVVVLTSSSQEQDIVASYRLGANSYIRKPVDFDKFMEAAAVLGQYWLVLNETAVRPGAGE
jgi:two-component system response regulator